MSAPLRAAAAGLGAAAALGGSALAWGVLIERRLFRVREERLAVLEPGSRPLTVLHLSDLHLAPWQRDKIEFVRSLAQYEPDLVINTGDNAGHRDALPAIRTALEPFAGVPGVYVHGSNDHYAPIWKNPLKYLIEPSGDPVEPEALDLTGMERFFDDELGWWGIEGAARAVELKGHRLEFYGTADAHRGWDRPGQLPGIIEQMREEVEWSDAAPAPSFSFGVTHAPYRRVLDAFAAQGTDLIVAGHTHGGQVRLPGLPALVTNCDIPRAQAQGVSLWQAGAASSLLEVSGGLGTSIYAPVRFACPPEAVVMELVPVGA